MYRGVSLGTLPPGGLYTPWGVRELLRGATYGKGPKPVRVQTAVRTSQTKEKNMRVPTNILILAREQLQLVLLEAVLIVCK